MEVQKPGVQNQEAAFNCADLGKKVATQLMNIGQKVTPVALEVFSYVKKPVAFGFGVFVALSMMAELPDYVSVGVVGLAAIAYGLNERKAVALAKLSVSIMC